MRITPIAITLTLLAGSFGAGAFLSQEKPLPNQVAYVDVGKVFENYRKREQVEDRINDEAEALEKRFKDRKGAIDEAEDAIALLNPRSEEYAVKDREIGTMRFQLKWDQEHESARLQDRARREKALLYKEITLEIAAYGEEHGLAAVHLFVPVTDEIENLRDLNLVTSTRTVLWHDDRLDVTDALVEQLNAQLPPEPAKDTKDSKDSKVEGPGK